MKKRLVFFIYVDSDYKNSKIYDIHFYNLKHFRYLFDKCIFWLSLKDFSCENLSFLSEIENKLIECGFSENVEIKIMKNDEYREALCFYDEILPMIKNGDKELVFFGHSKGLSNTYCESLLCWICAMYYYGLFFENEMNDAFSENGGKIFYGFPLMLSERCSMANKYFFAGTLFWIRTDLAKKIIDCGNYDFDFNCKRIINEEKRCFAENFPGHFFPIEYCYTHKDCPVPDWDVYFYYWDMVKNYYYNSIEDGEDDLNGFLEYYNKMLYDLNIVL